MQPRKLAKRICKLCGDEFLSNGPRAAYCKKPEHHSERIRIYSLKVKYGITVERYEEMLKSQNARCKICGTDKSQDGKRFHVDHSHKTGKVRGLLCYQCNRDVGFAEKPGVVEYVLEHREEV